MVILTVFQAPESPILCEQVNTRAILDNRDLGLGTVYVSERTFCWKGQEGLGFCIKYPHMSMHAVTSDPAIYPAQCVFIILDEHIILPGGLEVAPPLGDPKDGDESNCNESQLLIIPSEAGGIPAIYTALNKCQTSNPDAEDIIEEDVDEDAEDFGINNPTSDLGAGGDSDVGDLSVELCDHSLPGSGTGDQHFDDQFDDA